MNLEQIYRNLLNARETKNEYKGTIKGICMEYCPYFEFVERSVRGDISIYEKDILVKKYNRSSAGRQKAFPEDVRPLPILEKTLEYLLSFCKQDYSLELYKFIENRTRAIRLDISIQELDCDKTIVLLEKIARFHILYNFALHDKKEFESHLCLDQCKKILSTLSSFYTKRRQKGQNSENETEFISYYILISFDDKFLFLEEFIENTKIQMCFNLKKNYHENLIYNFFNLTRKFDFLCYCLLHTYFDNIRIRSIDIYSKCFVEKIEDKYFIDLLYTTPFELKSLCDKMNVSYIDNRLDFKIKDIFEKDDILVKERKENVRMNNPSLLIHIGDIDYKIFSVIKHLWVMHFMQNISKWDINGNINSINTNKDETTSIRNATNNYVTEKVKLENIFNRKEEAIVDIYNVVLKVFYKVTAHKFIKDLGNRILIFEKKKKLTTQICLFILDLCIKKLVKNKIEDLSKNTDDKKLAIVCDDSIFSAIYQNNVKKSILTIYKLDFLKFKEINLIDLIKYHTIVFSVNKIYLKEVHSKYKMLNVIVDVPQNLTKRIEEVDMLVRNSKKILKNKLSTLLSNKSRLKQISLITTLIKNGRNSDILQDCIVKIDRRERIDDIDVFYEEDTKFK